jgi:hypothetical protein
MLRVLANGDAWLRFPVHLYRRRITMAARLTLLYVRPLARARRAFARRVPSRSVGLTSVVSTDLRPTV